MGEATISLTTFRFLAPELILVVTASVIYVGGALVRWRGLWPLVALVGLGLASCALVLQDSHNALSDQASFEVGPLFADAFGSLTRWLAIGIGCLFTLGSWRVGSDRLASELMGSLLLAIAGTMLLGVAGDIVLLFLALEMISIPSYIVLYLGRSQRPSLEATVKYFFLSLLASAILLYGLSFLYGITGTTRLIEMAGTLPVAPPVPGGLDAFLPLAAALIVAGLGFKLGAAPFHFYAPDVYQGGGSAAAAVLAVLPKVAGVVVMLRLFAMIAGAWFPVGWQLLLGLAILTMTVGNVMALWQRNIRRLMAYSSIAHAGFLLLGLSAALAVSSTAARADGFAATLFYLCTYSIATAGVFMALTYLGNGQRDVEAWQELEGVGRSQPIAAAALAACLFSLAGIPILFGFWGKLQIFLAALEVWSSGATGRAWFVAAGIWAAVNAAIAAAYYLKIIAALYFQPLGRGVPATGGKGAALAATVAGLAVILLGGGPGGIDRATHAAADSLRRFDPADSASSSRIAESFADAVPASTLDQ